MIRKLLQVLNTYLHRKLFWFAALLYVLFLLSDWSMPVRESPRLWTENQVRWLPEQSFDGATAFVNWQASTEELDDLRSLTINGSYVVTSDEIGEDGQPLHEMKYDADTPIEFLQKLNQCIHLLELHLRSFKMTPELGDALARLPNLQRLELTLNGSPIPSMSNLPTLNQLRYFQVPHVPMSELGLLAKHPQLKTIELQDWPYESKDNTAAIWNKSCTLHEAKQIEEVILKPVDPRTWVMMQSGHGPTSSAKSDGAMPFNQSLIDSLAALPNLKTVEVRDPWGGWPARTIGSSQVDETLAVRSDVSVNPVVRSAETFANPFGLFATFMVVSVILIQLFDHFGTGMSRIVPGFTSAHLTVAACMLTVQCVISAYMIVERKQLAWMPSLAIATALPAVVAIAVGWVTRHPRWLPVLFTVGIWAALGLMFANRTLLQWLGGDDFLNSASLALVAKALLLLALEVSLIVWAAVG